MKNALTVIVAMVANMLSLKSEAQVFKPVIYRCDNDCIKKVEKISKILEKKNIDLKQHNQLEAVLNDDFILNSILNEMGSRADIKSNTSILDLVELLKINKYFKLQKNALNNKSMDFEGNSN